MGIVDWLMEGLGVVIYLLEVSSIFADIIAFVRSEDNRAIRRAAKKIGKNPPARDIWSKAFILFSIIVVLL